MRCLYLLLSSWALLRNTTPQEKNSWTASPGGKKREVLKREERFETNNDYIFCLTICYLPIIISRMFISTFVISSINSAYFVHFTGVFFVISNSLLNPIMHCVRMKQFRLALKESNQYLTKAIYRLEIWIKSKIFFRQMRQASNKGMKRREEAPIQDWNYFILCYYESSDQKNTESFLF